MIVLSLVDYIVTFTKFRASNFEFRTSGDCAIWFYSCNRYVIIQVGGVPIYNIYDVKTENINLILFY